MHAVQINPTPGRAGASPRRGPALFALAALLLVLAPACDSRANEANLEDERANFLIWSFVLNPALTDFASACGGAVTAGLSCATNAGGAGLYASGYLNANFSVNDASSAATACVDYPLAGVLLNYTAAARVCWFNCETAYWNAGQTTGSCTGANFTAYAANAFASITTCSNNCRAAGTFFIY